MRKGDGGCEEKGDGEVWKWGREAGSADGGGGRDFCASHGPERHSRSYLGEISSALKLFGKDLDLF